MDDTPSDHPSSAYIAEPMAVTEAEIRQFAVAIGLDHAAPGRCSLLLMFDLYCRTFSAVLDNPAKVVTEIRALENLGPTRTKPEDQFKHPPLAGLWKKHFLVGGLSSMAENIENEFGRERKVLRRIIKENYNPATKNPSPEPTSRNIADAVASLYTERSNKQRLTGEWIIYAKHEGRNYYLCLASHNEDDAIIFDRIKKVCLDEFSFLRNQLNS